MFFGPCPTYIYIILVVEFINYTAAHHQGATKLFGLAYWRS